VKVVAFRRGGGLDEGSELSSTEPARSVLPSPAAAEQEAGGPARLSDAPLPPLPAADETPLLPWPGRKVDVDGIGVFVRTAPSEESQEPALFVHGLGGSSSNWTDVMALLRHHLACEAVDLPGFGRSDPPRNGSYSLDSHAAAVVRLIETRGRGPVHLIGNSLGGAVSTRVAATRPDLVRSLTLVSPALPDLRPRRANDPLLPLLLLPGIHKLAWRRLQAQGAQARAQAVLDLCYHDPSRVHPQRLQEAAAEVARRAELEWVAESFAGSLRGLITSYLQRGPEALWQQAATVQLPVLVIWGRHDRLTDVRLAERAQRVFPDARLLVLDEAGHVAQLEHPEAVARAVLGRLEDFPPD
jgi:pimeloyl-ACP methyl ester carboxylesterase